jgi:glucan biosynthesis protein
MIAFYTSLLRFVAARTPGGDDRVDTMMAILRAAADSFDATGSFTATDLNLTARAFAGMAAMLQKQILPEAVANGHAEAERDIRWAVDTAMDAVNLLLRQATFDDTQPVTLTVVNRE